MQRANANAEQKQQDSPASWPYEAMISEHDASEPDDPASRPRRSDGIHRAPPASNPLENITTSQWLQIGALTLLTSLLATKLLFWPAGLATRAPTRTDRYLIQRLTTPSRQRSAPLRPNTTHDRPPFPPLAKPTSGKDVAETSASCDTHHNHNHSKSRDPPSNSDSRIKDTTVKVPPLQESIPPLKDTEIEAVFVIAQRIMYARERDAATKFAALPPSFAEYGRVIRAAFEEWAVRNPGVDHAEEGGWGMGMGTGTGLGTAMGTTGWSGFDEEEVARKVWEARSGTSDRKAGS